MIICTNCGATNNEMNGHICRKCGALLPISTKATRKKMSTKKEVKKSLEIEDTPKVEELVVKPRKSDLHEIPLKDDMQEEITKKTTDDKSKEKGTQNIEYLENIEQVEEEKEILKEITPKPYNGSIIVEKGVFGVKSQRKIIEEKKSSTTEIESGLTKQKQLVEDMTEVLKFLSEKISVKPLEDLTKQPEVKEKLPRQISPSNMNEILKNLLKLDVNIEASAIIQKDGTILASAISSRASDSLLGTIAQNLSMIGSDIVEGLNAGKLMNLSIRGSEGVLDLAPIDTKGKLKNELILIIFSHPKVKSGIIHFAANVVKKQVIQYLGLSK